MRRDRARDAASECDLGARRPSQVTSWSSAMALDHDREAVAARRPELEAVALGPRRVRTPRPARGSTGAPRGLRHSSSISIERAEPRRAPSSSGCSTAPSASRFAVDEAGIEAAGAELRRVAERAAGRRDWSSGRRRASPRAPPQSRSRASSRRRAMGDHLGDHRIVERRHRVALPRRRCRCGSPPRRETASAQSLPVDGRKPFSGSSA